MDRFNADHTYRAVYQGDEKMIAIEGLSSVLYNLAGDPREVQPYQDERRIDALAEALDSYLELAVTRRNSFTKQKISIKDEILQQRMKDLGYLE
jgi:hypothetical protein